MIKSIPEEMWNRYKELLPKTRQFHDPPLPETLAYQGTISGTFDYALPEELLQRLRKWLAENQQQSVFYFLTESIPEQKTDFEIGADQLTHAALASVNKATESAIVAKDFSWALFVDHEGALHVSGPAELFIALSE